jgi:hypothetical protein
VFLLRILAFGISEVNVFFNCRDRSEFSRRLIICGNINSCMTEYVNNIAILRNLVTVLIKIKLKPKRKRTAVLSLQTELDVRM